MGPSQMLKRFGFWPIFLFSSIFQDEVGPSNPLESSPNNDTCAQMLLLVQLKKVSIRKGMNVSRCADCLLAMGKINV
jgi:hypothetical protein